MSKEPIGGLAGIKRLEKAVVVLPVLVAVL